MLRLFPIILTFFLFIQPSIAQEEDSKCTRLKALTSSSSFMATENWKEATELFIKAEEVCTEFGKDNYDRLLTCIQYVMAEAEEESEDYYTYLDTLMMVWERAEAKGHYDQTNDMHRGYHYTLLKEPDYHKADFYMSRAIFHNDTMLDDEVYLLLYYYNLYSLWYLEKDEERKAMHKQRYLDEYISLCRIIKEQGYTSSTRQTLTQYFAQVINSCDDLLPLADSYLESLPKDPEARKTGLIDFGQLLIDQGCQNSKEFERFYGALINYDDPYLLGPIIVDRPCSARIPIYKEMKDNSADSLEKNELQYKIAACYLNMGSYNNAYVAAGKITGQYKNKALKIQAQAVAATANSCGNSTFERKCNYVYAAQLMEEAGLDGSKYRAMGPDEGLSSCIRTTSVILICWGVEVIVCE